MTLLDASVQRPNLRVSPFGTNTLVFQGVFREEDVNSWFSPLVDEVHARAVKHDLLEVVVDLRHLEYANAATWKCFLYWVQRLLGDVKAQYKIRVRGNSEHHWQRVGFPALVAFGKQRLVVEL